MTAAAVESTRLGPGSIVRVPSRTRDDRSYDVYIALDGKPVCQCEAAFNNLSCWHQDCVASEQEWSELDLATPERRRFWGKVDHSYRDSGCWLWTGAHDVYGGFSRSAPERMEGSHRVAFEFAFGAPERLVLHKCDTPLCCRPTHLFEGDHSDNLHDMYRKRRRHSLSEQALADIRRRLSTGDAQAVIAHDFGVTQQYISKVARRKELSMTTTTSTDLVPIKVSPPVAALPTEQELALMERSAKLIMAGAITLPEGVKTPQQAAAMVLYGWEMGLRPMTAMTQLYVVKGRVQPSAQVMLGVAQAREADIRLQIVHLSLERCTLRLLRPSRGINETYTVTWEDIARAGLESDMNKKYPLDRMMYHCTKRLMRIFCPDLIHNIEGVALPSATHPAMGDDDVDLSGLYNEGDDALEGSFRDVTDEHQEAAEQDVQATPSELLNAIGKAHGNTVMLQARGIIKHLYGVEELNKLSAPQRKDYAAKLHVWLTDKDHEHVEQFLEDGKTVVCEHCGVLAEAVAPHEHVEGFDEERAIKACTICGVAMEGPEFEGDTATDSGGTPLQPGLGA